MVDGVAAASHATPWRRHELVAVDPEAWGAALAGSAESSHQLLADWAKKGWPLIVRRRGRGDPPDHVPVGAPLPPSEGKRRIALALPPQSVTARFPLPKLDRVRQAAPSAWDAAIAALLALGDRLGLAPAAYGGLFWEFRTGLRYLTTASDLDLLWSVGPGADVTRLLEGLAEVERNAPMRLDGEIVFPDGRAAHWRELLRALGDDDAGEALVKTIDGAELRPARGLLSPAVLA